MWQSPNWMWFSRAARGQKQGAVSSPLSCRLLPLRGLHLTLVRPCPPRTVIRETWSPLAARFLSYGSIYWLSFHPPTHPGPHLHLYKGKHNHPLNSVCWNSTIKAWNCHAECRSACWIWITNKWQVIFSISNVRGKIWGHKYTQSYIWFT